MDKPIVSESRKYTTYQLEDGSTVTISGINHRAWDSFVGSQTPEEFMYHSKNMCEGPYSRKDIEAATDEYASPDAITGMFGGDALETSDTTVEDGVVLFEGTELRLLLAEYVMANVAMRVRRQ